jgi:hypothetical protein
MGKTHLCHRPLLKPSPPSLSPAMSRLNYCSNLWPTPLMVTMGLGTTPLQLRPPAVTSQPLICCSSLRQESLSRMITDFVELSLSLGSYVARRYRRLSSPHNSYMVMPSRGGPTTPPLAPRTTRCRGLSLAVPSVPTTF